MPDIDRKSWPSGAVGAMRDLIINHSALMGISIGLFLGVLLGGPLYLLHQKACKKFERSQPVIRRVTELEERDEGGIVAHLECGHQTLIAIPGALPCGICSIEVNVLKKMAGTK